MKKLYALLVAVLMCLGVNAQDAIYVCGAGQGLAWNPANPKVVTKADGNFTFEVADLTDFKVSTAKGSWNDFNGATLWVDLTADNLGTPLTISHNDSSLTPPWKGDYKVVVAGDLTTMTITTTTPKPTGGPVLYLRGTMNNWGYSNDWKFTKSETSETTYSLDCKLSKDTQFKVADESWALYNYGAGTTVHPNTSATWYHNGQNSIMGSDFDGTVTIVLPSAPKEPMTVTLTPRVVENPDVPVVPDTLFFCGSGEGLTWDYINPLAVLKNNDVYTLEVKNLTSFRLSTTKSVISDNWAGFNAGALTADITKDDLGKAVQLEAYQAETNNENIVTPWAGDYTIVVSGDRSTITLTTTTPEPAGFAKVYLRGGMNGWGNAAGSLEGWQFNTNDGKEYTLTCKIPLGTEFKLADANWGAVNYSNGGKVYSGVDTNWYYNNSNNTVMGEDFDGVVTATVPSTPQEYISVKFTSGSSVANVAVEAGEAEYFNLQGVRVLNPQNGVFIMRQGGKVSKVVK